MWASTCLLALLSKFAIYLDSDLHVLLNLGDKNTNIKWLAGRMQFTISRYVSRKKDYYTEQIWRNFHVYIIA